jgi:hypothetical protein
LASFWGDDGGNEADDTRAARLGRALGRGLGRARKLPPPPQGEDFAIDAGFLHRFTRAEVTALAAAVERTVTWEPDAAGASFVTLGRRRS